jgi:hypothetical protein
VLPTGEKFRTEAELIAAQIEAKYTIRELRNTNALLAANRNAEPPTPQADPAKQFITAKTQRLVDKGFEPAAAKVLAEDAWEDHKALRGEVTQTQQEARHEAFILSNPILATELADQVAQDYGRRTGRYPSDPATHLDLVLAHYARNGMEIPAQYKTGGSSMAPGARTILPGNVQGSSGPGCTAAAATSSQTLWEASLLRPQPHPATSSNLSRTGLRRTADLPG